MHEILENLSLRTDHLELSLGQARFNASTSGPMFLPLKFAAVYLLTPKAPNQLLLFQPLLLPRHCFFLIALIHVSKEVAVVGEVPVADTAAADDDGEDGVTDGISADGF